MSFFVQIQELYNKFLSYFPSEFHPFISLILGVMLFVSIVQVLRKEFIWLILLVILLPASVPILRGIADVIIQLLKYLFGLES